MGHAVTYRVIDVVVVVRLRVNGVRRACDIEVVVNHKCDVLFSLRKCVAMPT